VCIEKEDFVIFYTQLIFISVYVLMAQNKQETDKKEKLREIDELLLDLCCLSITWSSGIITHNEFMKKKDTIRNKIHDLI